MASNDETRIQRGCHDNSSANLSHATVRMAAPRDWENRSLDDGWKDHGKPRECANKRVVSAFKAFLQPAESIYFPFRKVSNLLSSLPCTVGVVLPSDRPAENSLFHRNGPKLSSEKSILAHIWLVSVLIINLCPTRLCSVMTEACATSECDVNGDGKGIVERLKATKTIWYTKAN